jgi:recombination protein RecT
MKGTTTMANLEEMKADQQAGTNELARRASHPIIGKTEFLEKRKDLLGVGIPGHMTVEREIRTATVMLMQSKKLQQATPQSFYVAVSVAINSGIGLGNGKGYLVPYKQTVSFVPGWKGLVDLVNRSGRASAWTGVVHKGDEFEYALGDSPFLKHKPGDNEDHQDITHYYAIGRVKGSDWPHIVVWSVNKVVRHLNTYNKVGGEHYALKNDDNMDAYGRKVVLLQVIKYLPTSQEIDNAIAADKAHAAGKNVTIDGNCVFVDDDDTITPMDPVDDIPRTDKVVAEEPSEMDKRRQDAETVEVKESDPSVDADRTHKSVAAQMQAAKNLDELAEAADLINTVRHGGLRTELTSMYRSRMEEFESPKEQQKPAAPAKRGKGTKTAAPE